ncbi:hypothetical protein GKR70_01490 [Providencia alcalifaciens]|uniref:hypothetical protein n=1 Tax=Providencia alcalifaciens TaxID=126385 RepID=UPI0012B5CD1B|nr:hypothetical protein [Providencia alcalifaciens]MTC37222.1 hypothetical protein [Providencia alcalifaciens]
MASGLEKYLNGLAERLNATEVRVGFFPESTYGDDGTPVATVAYANEYGVPENNQPSRPFFRNAIDKHKDEWVKSISNGLASGLDANDVLEGVGAKVQMDVRDSITELMEPALSASTIRARRTRKVRRNESTKPLIDTGVMYESVNYEVIDDQG